MGKKMEEAEVKKECPSCGLGVALDSTVCEFCGWDFEEEDEWILQIEKLERDLMLEKQKFEPGSVNQKIESTLHTPSIERIEHIRARQGQDASDLSPGETSAPARPAPPAPAKFGEQKGFREARPTDMEIRRSSTAPPERREETPGPVSAIFERQTSPEAKPAVQAGSAKVRRVRTVKAPQSEETDEVRPDDGSRKKKLVRKVKK